jgi:hypothetical protein
METEQPDNNSVIVLFEVEITERGMVDSVENINKILKKNMDIRNQIRASLKDDSIIEFVYFEKPSGKFLLTRSNPDPREFFYKLYEVITDCYN